MSTSPALLETVAQTLSGNSGNHDATPFPLTVDTATYYRRAEALLATITPQIEETVKESVFAPRVTLSDSQWEQLESATTHSRQAIEDILNSAGRGKNQTPEKPGHRAPQIKVKQFKRDPSGEEMEPRQRVIMFNGEPYIVNVPATEIVETVPDGTHAAETNYCHQCDRKAIANEHALTEGGMCVLYMRELASHASPDLAWEDVALQSEHFPRAWDGIVYFCSCGGQFGRAVIRKHVMGIPTSPPPAFLELAK